MVILVGTPKKIFKIIYNRYNSNNLINSDELQCLFPNEQELRDDLAYLKNLDLIDYDYNWNYLLTSKGRIYFKLKLQYYFDTAVNSIFCPIIVAFITTLITLWLKGSL